MKNDNKKFISTAMRLRMEGMEEGIEKGIEKEKRKVAFSLLKQGISDEIILNATKLSQEELNYLKTIQDFQIDLELV